MNFGLVFCLVGLLYWSMQLVHKITECANSKGGLPDWEELRDFRFDERTRRNTRALKIGAIFFIVFGLFVWKITAGERMDNLHTIYAFGSLLLILLLYRFSGGQPINKPPILINNLLASLRVTGFFPDHDDTPSKIVRGANIFLIFDALLVIYLYLLLTLPD